MYNEMQQSVTEKQFYSDDVLKTLTIQYPRNMALETEETGTKPVLRTHRSAKKPKREQIQWSLVQQTNKYCNQN